MAVGGNRSAWPSRDDFTFASLLVIVLGGAFLFWQAWVNFHTEISELRRVARALADRAHPALQAGAA